jgi:hypothetical protein
MQTPAMKKFFILATATLFSIAACVPSSSITNSWKAENRVTRQFNKIVVLGLLRDESIRQQMEKHIVSDLQSIGYPAVCSCEEYDPRAFEGLTEAQAIQKLHSLGVDAVLTVVLLNKAKEKYYVPGRVYSTPLYPSHNHYWQYYQNVRGRINSTGYYLTSTKYFWESNLYDLQSDQLIYSAQSTSFDPASSEALAHEYGQLIVNSMTRANVLGAVKKGF